MSDENVETATATVNVTVSVASQVSRLIPINRATGVLVDAIVSIEFN